VARVEVEGKACLAMPNSGRWYNLQLHDICVYPSLWRTVLNQHFICHEKERAWEAGRTKLRVRMKGLIIFRARDA
jgi:hypothetical protein